MKAFCEVAVFGGGKGGQMLKVFLEETGYIFKYFIDDILSGCEKTNKDNLPVVGGIFSDRWANFNLLKRFDMMTFAHPLSYVCRSASLGKGSIVKPRAMIGHNVKIGKMCIVDSGVNIEHDSVVEDNCYISIGTNIGSSVLIEEGTVVGIGVNVNSGVRIGRGCIIGNGVTVMSDVPSVMQVKKKIDHVSREREPIVYGTTKEM